MGALQVLGEGGRCRRRHPSAATMPESCCGARQRLTSLAGAAQSAAGGLQRPHQDPETKSFGPPGCEFPGCEHWAKVRSLVYSVSRGGHMWMVFWCASDALLWPIWLAGVVVSHSASISTVKQLAGVSTCASWQKRNRFTLQHFCRETSWKFYLGGLAIEVSALVPRVQGKLVSRQEIVSCSMTRSVCILNLHVPSPQHPKQGAMGCLKRPTPCIEKLRTQAGTGLRSDALCSPAEVSTVESLLAESFIEWMRRE